MQHSTPTNQRDILNAQSNTENNHNSNYGNEEIINRKQLEGTPFQLITQQGKTFVVIGINKITPDFDTEQEAMNYIDENHWNITGTIVTIIVEAILAKRTKEMGEAIDRYAQEKKETV